MGLVYTNIRANIKGAALAEWVLRPTDRVVIRWLNGLWTCNPQVTPHRYDANGNPNYKAKRGYLYAGANEGCLIACVGIPAVARFAVNNHGIVGNGKCAGQLWIACNDEWTPHAGTGYADNQGEITIEVSYLSSFLNSLRSDDEIVEFMSLYRCQIATEILAEVGSTVRDIYEEIITSKIGGETPLYDLGPEVHVTADQKG